MIETTELYNGEIVCEFNPQRHTYVIVNKGRRYKVPSVTRITSVLDKSGPLMGWAVNCTLDVCKGAIGPGVEYAESYLEAVWKAAKGANIDIKKQAAERGTNIHRLVEKCLVSGTDGSSGPQERHLVEELAAFTKREGIRVRNIEGRIYSRRYRYSGTYDLLGELEEQRDLVLVDWKTGKSSLYPEYRLQTAAYCHAVEEEHPNQKIKGRYLVHITEDGSLEPFYFPRSTLRKDFQAFLGAKALFDRVQQIEKESKK